MRRSRSIAQAAVLLVLGALAALPAAAPAATSGQIVALLNRERAANGIPAGVSENTTWSAACRAHNAYEHRNNVFGHAETEGKPGYSREGNLIAATSVLAQGIRWGPGDPYDNAPYHLFDLLNPRISSTGAADSEGFGCVEILLGTKRGAPSGVTLYSYPGNGRRGVPFAQSARELPESPAETLGLGIRATGPNLLVYLDGPWTNGSRAQLTNVSLRWSHGAVATRWLDNTTSNLLAPTGAILVPVSALRPATKYRVSVEGSVQGVRGGTTIDQALAGECRQQPDGSVDCGQPAATSCVEEFAAEQAVCGLAESWPFKQSFSFTTAPRRRR